MNAPFPLAADSAIAPRPERASKIQVAGILCLAVMARAIFWNVRPPDMSIFQEPWFAHIVRWGPIQAFAHPFSNYEPAYLYLLALGSFGAGVLAPMTIIKIISVLGTLFLTLAFAELLKAAAVPRAHALLLLVLPTVVFNDALFAQCDALWAGACILALARMISGRTISAMVWCGVGIAFKAQAAFMAPVIVGAMIGRRAPLWQWAVPGLVYLTTLVPPIILGWPAIRLLTVYVRQASGDQLAGRLANPWMFGTIYGEDIARQWFFVGYLAAGAAALTIAALAARNPRNPKLLILLAAIAGTALPFLLPKMLERYYFLGDVMTLALVFSHPTRTAFFAMCAVQMASILSHLTLMYFFYQPYPALVGAAFAGAGLLVMSMFIVPDLKSLVAEVVTKITERTSAIVLKAS